MSLSGLRRARPQRGPAHPRHDVGKAKDQREQATGGRLAAPQASERLPPPLPTQTCTALSHGRQTEVEDDSQGQFCLFNALSLSQTMKNEYFNECGVQQPRITIS